VDYTHSSRHHINEFARPKVSPTCKCYCYNQQLPAFTASLCKVLCEVWRLLNKASCQHYSGKGVGHNKQSRLIHCGSGVNDIRHRIYNAKDPISLFLNDKASLPILVRIQPPLHKWQHPSVQGNAAARKEFFYRC
jgi:hypothetical protein